MRHDRTILTLAAGTVLAASTALLLPMTAQAAVACNETALVAAVTAANGRWDSDPNPRLHLHPHRRPR